MKNYGVYRGATDGLISGGGALDLTWATRGLSLAYLYDYAATQIFTFDHEVDILALKD